MMKLLIFGDVYGRVGRKGLKKELPHLIESYKPDFVIANVDNISSGRGAIEKHVRELHEAGVDIMTGGDHIFDNFSKIESYLLGSDSGLLRFANLWDEDTPGTGYKVFEKNDKKLLLIHLQGTVFMHHHVKNPHLVAEKIIESSEVVDAVVVDFHKETASEGYGMAYYLDGKADFIYGTHTHVQTNDDQILENGTGIISDVGMNGPRGSVIGADFASVKKRFISGIQKGKIEQKLTNDYLVSGVYVEIEAGCQHIEKIRIESSL